VEHPYLVSFTFANFQDASGPASGSYLDLFVIFLWMVAVDQPKKIPTIFPNGLLLNMSFNKIHFG
jgi:hypothetical protein